MSESKFHFRLQVTADSPEEESFVVKRLAKAFVDLGIRAVVEIADGKQIHYVNGQPHDVTDSMRTLFSMDPHGPTETYVETDGKK